MRQSSARGLCYLLPLIVLAAVPTRASTTLYRYALDGTNSAVSAKVAFLGLASKTAHFPAISGRVALSPDNLQAIDLDVAIDARQLRAGDSVTLSRLKGPAFFDVEHYPTVRFQGQSMSPTGRQSADVAGELTARGITRPATLRVTFDRPISELQRSQTVGLNGRMTINRRDFGMTSYSLIVGNQVTIDLKVRMVPD